MTEPEDPAGLFFKQIGPALTVHRKRRGLSSAALARMSATGKSQLSKYEAGKELPKLETLTRILDALGLHPIWFFYTAHRLSSTPPDIETALALERVANPPAGLLSSQEEVGFQRVLSELLFLHRATLEARADGIWPSRRTAKDEDVEGESVG